MSFLITDQILPRMVNGEGHSGWTLHSASDRTSTSSFSVTRQLKFTGEDDNVRVRNHNTMMLVRIFASRYAMIMFVMMRIVKLPFSETETFRIDDRWNISWPHRREFSLFLKWTHTVPLNASPLQPSIIESLQISFSFFTFDYFICYYYNALLIKHWKITQVTSLTNFILKYMFAVFQYNIMYSSEVLINIGQYLRPEKKISFIHIVYDLGNKPSINL